jgi:hypothetical protein
MTEAPYIQLTTSTGTSKKFRVPMGTLKPVFAKNQTRRRTANGRSDNAEGAIIRSWSLTLKVRGVASGSDPDGATYGTRIDLETFFGYNNPNGSPSNRFTYTDHSGATFTVDLIGQMDQEYVTPNTEGSGSWHYITITLERVS